MGMCSQCENFWAFAGPSLNLAYFPDFKHDYIKEVYRSDMFCRPQCAAGLGSNTYLYLQIQIQIQIRRICICICIWSIFKPCICICICIWSTVFDVFDKYVFKYTFPGLFSEHKFMENKLTWISFINMLRSATLFQNKYRGLILLIPIGGCVCALDLACQWVWQAIINSIDMNHFAMPLEQGNV